MNYTFKKRNKRSDYADGVRLYLSLISTMREKFQEVVIKQLKELLFAVRSMTPEKKNCSHNKTSCTAGSNLYHIKAIHQNAHFLIYTETYIMAIEQHGS